MKKLLPVIILGFLTLVACEKSYKICEFETTDDTLKIYNDILNELVVHHFYGGYLGEKGEALWEKYADSDRNDSTMWEKYDQERVEIHNEIFNDTSQYRTICLANSIRYGPREYSSLENQSYIDTARYWRTLNIWLEGLSSDWKSVAEILSIPQKEYSPSDFHLCTARVVPYEKWLKGCDIGFVSFSKIITDKEMKTGILYYEFMCGGKCGMGEILMIEKSEGRWVIRNKTQLWIS